MRNAMSGIPKGGVRLVDPASSTAATEGKEEFLTVSRRGRRLGWRLLVTLAWMLALAVPCWILAALLVDRATADIVAYAGATCGLAVGINVGPRLRRRSH
jgi:hypothetical protein